MKKTMYMAALLLTISLAFTSCKKVEGPKGEKGDTGAKGPGTIKQDSPTIYSTDWLWNPSRKRWEFSYSYATSINAIVSAYLLSGEILPAKYDYGTGTLSFMVSTDKITFIYYDGTANLARPQNSIFLNLKVIEP